MALNNHPVLVPQIDAWPREARPPSLGRGHEVLIVGKRNRGGLAWREAELLYPDVNLGFGEFVWRPGDRLLCRKPEMVRTHR